MFSSFPDVHLHRVEEKQRTHEEERETLRKEYEYKIATLTKRAENAEVQLQKMHEREEEAREEYKRVQEKLQELDMPLAQDLKLLKEMCQNTRASTREAIESTRCAARDAVNTLAHRASEERERAGAENVRADALSGQVNRLRAEFDDAKWYQKQLEEQVANEQSRRQTVAAKVQPVGHCFDLLAAAFLLSRCCILIVAGG